MDSEKSLGNLDRRTFLRILSFTGVSGLIYPRKLVSSPTSTDLSRVVIVEDETASSGNTINEDTVRVMVDKGICALTEQDDVGEAWKSIMPNLGATGTIAIKVNCRSSALPTHPEVTNAVVEGLLQMNFDGESFPENSIHIYDNYKAYFKESGYTLNSGSTGVRCYTTTSYSSQRYNVNGSSQKLATLVTDTADYIINIAVLKNHSSMAGATLCMKNHFGSCENPRSMHVNYGDPYIPALNALEPIASKQCINILDAIYGAAEGGPYGGPTFIANKILMSQDIVAIDYLGREMLEEQESSTVSWATYIDSGVDYGLGTNDPEQMEIIHITNPATGITTKNNPAEAPAEFRLEQNFPNPFNNQTQIRFYFADSRQMDLGIYNTNGQRVRNLINKTLNAGWHQISWDGTNDAGKTVTAGTYICQLKTDTYKKAIIVQFLK